MNATQTYLDYVVRLYTQTHPHADPDAVREESTRIAERYVRDIPCQMKNNIRHEVLNTSMLDVLEWIKTRNPIISGNGTFFKQHKEYLAPSVVMLESLQKLRKSVKGKMFDCAEGSPEYINLNTQQGSIKVIMNADYGGSGTSHSPFYSVYIPPATTGTAKNITTTLICCLEFISCNENKWAKIKNINGLFDMIRAVLEDTEERNLIQDRYSVEDVLKHLISRVADYSTADVIVLRSYLGTLSPENLTKLMLAFNVRLVLRKYLVGEMRALSDYMKTHQLDLDNITVETLHASGFGVSAPEELQGIFDIVNKTIVDNCCYRFMLNDAETRAWEMQRDIVCVTDTDSLMVHFASYVDDFQTRVDEFRDSCLMASAIGVRLFIETIIPKMVSYVALGCNIQDEYYRKKFQFKNEFGFLAMALVAKKMYASSMFVQEGKPRNIHKVAISGMSFKKRDAAEFLGPVMTDLYEKDILTVKRIQPGRILDRYYEWRQILNDNLDRDTSYYQVAGLKSIDAYKVLPEAMRGSIIWNAMMPEEEMLPMDRVIVIKLSFQKMQEHQNDNPRIAQMLRNCLIGNENMKRDPVICIPEHYKDIPDWIRPCIDKDGAIDKLLSPFKQILSLFDVNTVETRGGMIASRMICI